VPSPQPSHDARVFDPRLDLYIAKAAPFARPILEYIRECVHEACPDVVETMKWQMPFFCHTNGKVVVFAGAFKQHLRFGIWNAEAAASLREAAGHNAGATGSTVIVRTMKDLPTRKKMLASFRKAWKDAGEGKTVMRRRDHQTPKPPLEVPADLAAALKKSKPAQFVFDKFSPSCQREYINWINEAKQQATRERRLEQAVAWMAEGKQRNWKYQMAK
jgi:uncharacterized protein YdeI (YjbR/CyaY-like superfamily)